MIKFGKTTKSTSSDGRLNDVEVLLSILDNMPSSIFVKDEELRFVYSNNMHCDLIGKAESALLGKSDADFYISEMAKDFIAKDRAVIKTGQSNESEETAARKDGKELKVITRKARHIAPNGKTYLIGTNIDLTELKLREQQYRVLAESVPVGILQINEDGSITFSNGLALRHLGLKTHPKQMAEITGLLDNIESGFPSRESKFEANVLDGGRRLLFMSSGWANAGSERSAIVSIVDISEMAALRSKVEEKSNHLGAIINQTRESVAAIARNTAGLSGGAANLSKHTEAQMANLQSMSTAVRQLADVVKQNSNNAALASKLSNDATLVAEEGNQMSHASIEAIAKMTGSTQKIASIVDLIQEIAFQTNLLALNAAVEAARAGDAGRGFAVVAAEVRTLAQRSAQALKDVRNQINEGNEQISDGEKLIHAMGTKLLDITHITKQTATLVSGIATASQEQASAVQQVNVSVSQLEKVAQFNAQLVGKVTQSVDSVDRAMSALIGQVETSTGDGREAA